MADLKHGHSLSVNLENSKEKTGRRTDLIDGWIDGRPVGLPASVNQYIDSCHKQCQQFGAENEWPCSPTTPESKDKYDMCSLTLMEAHRTPNLSRTTPLEKAIYRPFRERDKSMER